MKCLNCGKEIADDSKFCEFCGAKITSRQTTHTKVKWIVPLCLLVGIIAVIVVFSLSHNNSYQSSNDLADMNIKYGKVTKIVERSYYLGSEIGPTEQAFEGGLFDGAAFLSLVYSNEHMGRCFYKKWFLTQISDCEIQFDKYGNVILIKSIWDDGGQIHFSYDDNHRMKEMDGRNPARNQSEDLVRYKYKLEGKRISEETQVQIDEYGEHETTITYHYDTKNNLCRAIMNNRGEYIFTYEGNTLCDIYLQDFWGKCVPASYQIEYNTKGDISKITATGNKGRSELARTTTFEYTYDSHNNWTERIGKTCLANGKEYLIRSTRTYVYE